MHIAPNSLKDNTINVHRYTFGTYKLHNQFWILNCFSFSVQTVVAKITVVEHKKILFDLNFDILSAIGLKKEIKTN